MQEINGVWDGLWENLLNRFFFLLLLLPIARWWLMVVVIALLFTYSACQILRNPQLTKHASHGGVKPIARSRILQRGKFARGKFANALGWWRISRVKKRVNLSANMVRQIGGALMLPARERDTLFSKTQMFAGLMIEWHAMKAQHCHWTG